jgi:biopolymer transport protein ExbB
MGFSLSEMWGHMGVPAKAVFAILIVMGLASLTVFIERVLTLRRSRRASREFASESGGHVRAHMIDTVVDEASKYPQGHLPRLVKAALSTYRHARETADVSVIPPAERTRRHMERYLEDLGADLRRGLSVLATVGSIAPFVGLLGTVLGIISAFQGIAAAGSGGLSAVSAGISEALIETALGLAVAIPAVLAFNYLTGLITREETGLNSAAGELLDTIEGWAEDEVHERERERALEKGTHGGIKTTTRGLVA